MKNQIDESQEEKNEPLLSITTNTPPIKKPSAFNEAINRSSELPKKEEKPEVEIVSSQPFKQPVKPIVQPQEPQVRLVYEVMFMNGEEEVKLYSFSVPEFGPGELRITNAFGKHEMIENVLGVNTVKTQCKADLDQSSISIDLTQGALIKTLPEERWMHLDYEETKRIFDEAVLRAYRNAAQAAAPTITPTTKQGNKKVSVNPNFNPQNSEGNWTEGNIPVNRPPLIRDL